MEFLQVANHTTERGDENNDETLIPTILCTNLEQEINKYRDKINTQQINELFINNNWLENLINAVNEEAKWSDPPLYYSLQNGFKGAKQNEIKRDKVAVALSNNPFVKQINKQGRTHFEILFSIFAISINILRWSNLNFEFGANGSLNRKFSSKEISQIIFAEEYIGDKEMHDPGRLAIKKSNFTVFPKGFRNLLTQFLFKGTFNKTQVFTVDIAGF